MIFEPQAGEQIDSLDYRRAHLIREKKAPISALRLSRIPRRPTSVSNCGLINLPLACSTSPTNAAHTTKDGDLY